MSGVTTTAARPYSKRWGKVAGTLNKLELEYGVFFVKIDTNLDSPGLAIPTVLGYYQLFTATL